MPLRHEPLANEEWYTRYLKKSAEHKEQNEMLKRRLDGLEMLNHGENKT